MYRIKVKQCVFLTCNGLASPSIAVTAQTRNYPLVHSSKNYASTVSADKTINSDNNFKSKQKSANLEDTDSSFSYFVKDDMNLVPISKTNNDGKEFTFLREFNKLAKWSQNDPQPEIVQNDTDFQVDTSYGNIKFDGRQSTIKPNDFSEIEIGKVKGSEFCSDTYIGHGKTKTPAYVDEDGIVKTSTKLQFHQTEYDSEHNYLDHCSKSDYPISHLSNKLDSEVCNTNYNGNSSDRGETDQHLSFCSQNSTSNIENVNTINISTSSGKGSSISTFKKDEHIDNQSDSLNYFDQLLFPDNDCDQEDRSQYNSKPDVSEVPTEDLNYFDELLLSGSSEIDRNSPKQKGIESTYSVVDFEELDQNSLNYFDQMLLPKKESKVTGHSSDSNTLEDPGVDVSTGVMRDISISEDSYLENDILASDCWSKNSKKKTNENISEKEHTAYHEAMKIRKELRTDHRPNFTANVPDPKGSRWTGKLDSKGYRILTEQVQDLTRFPSDSVVHMLKMSIIYEDDELIAINKPYGLASHGGPGIHNSIGKLLGPLAQRLDKDLERLYLVHRLDKEATGVMLLAKNLDCTNRLLKMFKKRQVIKKYWLITKGVPNPTEGVIDIPICESVVNGKRRMALKPYYSSEMREDPSFHAPTRGMSGAKHAITNFRVMDSHMGAALVECQPESGVKHQIRCHMAFGINTPILGDHKYSHLSKLAPQKLSSEMLSHMKIRQTKVRHVPMHLHAASLVLPEFKDGRNLFFKARLPRFFVQNMNWLKLKLEK